MLGDTTRCIIRRAKPAERGKTALPTEQMAPWPSDDAVIARQDIKRDWHFTARQDIVRAKRERMERALRRKRAAGVVRRRAVCVWAFFVPGWLFSGWWMYLRGISGQDYRGGGFKGNVTGELLKQVRAIFAIPMQRPLYGEPDDADYVEAFAGRYQRGRRGGKPQGMASCWALVDGDQVLSLEGA